MVTQTRARKRTVKPRRVFSGLGTRQRMALLGQERLSEVELIALLLGGGDGAVERALRVVMSLGGLPALERASPHKIARVAGVTLDEALALVAALELGRRVAGSSLSYARTIDGPQDVAEFLRASLGSASQERFLVLGLDVHRHLHFVRTVAVGGLAVVHVHPREVFRPVVEASMDSCILVHNHPGGCTEPSDADVMFTYRMMQAGSLLGIRVLDHLIITRSGATSLAALGYLGPMVDSGRYGSTRSARARRCSGAVQLDEDLWRNRRGTEEFEPQFPLEAL